MKMYGVADIPCDNLEKDELDVKNYVYGLERFVANCHTPMAIALQGDWGTGKTSFLQAMINDFKAKQYKEYIIPIYFNTWQYSQFKMSGNLYTSFLSNIITELGEKACVKDKANTMLNIVAKATKSIASQVVKNVTDVDVEKVAQEIFKREEEQAKAIKELRSHFEEMIKEICANDKERARVVIFVDDLDRLNPEIAVELLEVMKLFMDVPNCVFVLAIDYEVVVNGVRKKFGNDMSEEKCRSFFDKIIQLPFRMPVESYSIEKLIKSVLGGRLDSYIEPVSNLVKNTMGANPRTFKRIANSFVLLEIVENCKNGNADEEDMNRTDECQSALLFISLVIQLYCNDAYGLLIECEDGDSLKALLKDAEEEDTEQQSEKVKDTIGFLRETILEVEKRWKEENKGKKDIINIFDKFQGAINLSAITSVTGIKDTEGKERKKAMQVTRIILGEKEIKVKNPTYAQIETFNYILEKNQDKIEEFMKAYPRIMTLDDTRNDGFFRASKELSIPLNGQKLFIGTSSSSADKLLFTRHLCEFMAQEKGSIKWLDGDMQVFIYE